MTGIKRLTAGGNKQVFMFFAVLLLVVGIGMTGRLSAAEVSLGPDPELVMSTQDVKSLFDQEFGDDPLMEAVLEFNETFVMVDARSWDRYQQGHIHGALHLPPGDVAANMDQLPHDRKIIFYGNGLLCPLAEEAARVAIEKGHPDVKVYNAGVPGWHNVSHLVTTAPYVKSMLTFSGEQKFMLIDARPVDSYRKAHLPGALSLPNVEWDFKKDILPSDLDTQLVFYCSGQH